MNDEQMVQRGSTVRFSICDGAVSGVGIVREIVVQWNTYSQMIDGSAGYYLSAHFCLYLLAWVGNLEQLFTFVDEDNVWVYDGEIESVVEEK